MANTTRKLEYGTSFFLEFQKYVTFSYKTRRKSRDAFLRNTLGTELYRRVSDLDKIIFLVNRGIKPLYFHRESLEIGIKLFIVF